MKLVSQTVSFEQRNPNCAVYENVGYASAEGPEMIRVRFEELSDDIYDHYTVDFSSDHGETWGDAQDWTFGQKVPGGTLRRLFLQGKATDPVSDRVVMMGMEGVLRNDHALDGMTQYYPIYRASEDGGRTWIIDERAIQRGEEFSEGHPFDGVWVGKNSVMPANAPVSTRDGRLLVPCNVTLLGEDDEYFCPGGAHTFTGAGVMIGSWLPEGSIEWDYARLVEIPVEKSLRGAIEPTLAEMPDGRILMVLRAADGMVEKVGGRKWYCISEDGAHTWSEPQRWTYHDDTPFYSPSSISILMWHSSGTLYWFGNICEEPPQGNLPRYPLVVGRVDPQSLLLERDSMFTIDTRKTGDSETLQLSNFCVYEDRRTGHIVLHMTRWDGHASGGPEAIDANVNRYEIDPE